jgi:hypothetical protein
VILGIRPPPALVLQRIAIWTLFLDIVMVSGAWLGAAHIGSAKDKEVCSNTKISDIHGYY